MPGLERYCHRCGEEIATDGTTMYPGKKVCKC